MPALVAEPVARRLATLEGAEAGLVLASGTAAIACTLLALLRTGDHLLASSWLRPATRRFFDQALPALGVQVTFFDPSRHRNWRRSLTRTTRALFVETPVLTSTRVLDLRPPRVLAQELGLALIVDATAATPVHFTPLAHGADVVVHDARVLMAGAEVGELGVVCGTEALRDEVRTQMHLWGAVPHPAAVAALSRGLATLDVRLARQNATARAVAEWAVSAPAVASVMWPGAPSHPDHVIATSLLRDFGPSVVLDLHDGHLAQRLLHTTVPNDRGPLTTHVLAGDTPTQLRVVAGVEPSDRAVAWLAAHLG